MVVTVMIVFAFSLISIFDFLFQFILIAQNCSTIGLSITTIFIGSMQSSIFFWVVLLLDYNSMIGCSGMIFHKLQLCYDVVFNMGLMGSDWIQMFAVHHPIYSRLRWICPECRPLYCRSLRLLQIRPHFS